MEEETPGRRSLRKRSKPAALVQHEKEEQLTKGASPNLSALLSSLTPLFRQEGAVQGARLRRLRRRS